MLLGWRCYVCIQDWVRTVNGSTMGDKSIPEITIKLYPATLWAMAGTILGLMAIVGFGLWGRGDSPSLAPAPGDPGTQVTLGVANGERSPWPQPPTPAEVAQALEVPFPEDTTWTGAMRQTQAMGGGDIPGARPALSPTPGSAKLGLLRVGNQTPHPVRLVVLQRSAPAPRATPGIPEPGGNPPSAADRPVPPPVAPQEPTHWDFAPAEGWQYGLILSLPQENMTLKPEDLNLKGGDVLIAFAQDGSQGYWGPFVVGESPLPVWDEQHQEWELLLR